MDSTEPKGQYKAAGIGGIGFLILVIAENILRGAPPADDQLTSILQFYTEGSPRLAISHSLYILTIPCLLLYASGIFKFLKNGTLPNVWLSAGVSAVLLLPISFAIVIIMDVVLLIMSEQGQQASILPLFKLHAAAFVINSAVLGTAMLGLGKAASDSSRLPKWAGILAIIGGILLLLSAIPVHLVIGGSPWGFIGLAGFLMWLVWVGYTSVRMIKA